MLIVAHNAQNKALEDIEFFNIFNKKPRIFLLSEAILLVPMFEIS